MKIKSKRLKKYKGLFCILIGLWANMSSYAQDNPSIVSYKINSPGEIYAGDSVKIVVVLDVKPGFYIYSPTEMNSSQGMQVTQLRFVQQQLPAGLQKAGGLQFPEPHPKGAYQVFMGKGIKYTQAFVASKDMQPGEITLKGKLVYQACNDHICYPSVTEPFEAVIEVLK